MFASSGNGDEKAKENMSGAAVMASEMGVPFLGSIPMDPRLLQCCEQGQSFLESYSNSDTANSINQFVDSKTVV